MPINPETAVSYAALILADEGVEVTSDKLQTLLDAAGVMIEPIWSTLFSKALKDKDLKEILTTIQISESGPVGTSLTGEKETCPVSDTALEKDVPADGEGSESGSDIGLDLFGV